MKYITRVNCWKNTSVEFERYDPGADEFDKYCPRAYRERTYRPTDASLTRLARVAEKMVNDGQAHIRLSPPAWEIEI